MNQQNEPYLSEDIIEAFLDCFKTLRIRVIPRLRMFIGLITIFYYKCSEHCLIWCTLCLGLRWYQPIYFGSFDFELAVGQ